MQMVAAAQQMVPQKAYQEKLQDKEVQDPYQLLIPQEHSAELPTGAASVSCAHLFAAQETMQIPLLKAAPQVPHLAASHLVCLPALQE
mmetsp:Transcript_61740/g.144848  ORF Transcript_61740/g.144848 Transcript_61740/m.144848 type:complete len:88 (-) Transcript_61740:1021-1284(-)